MRKAALNEVVRVQDIVGAIDITGIQQYERNGFKVLHLTKRGTCRGSMVRLKRQGGRPHRFECISCKRALMDVAQFCSVGCKVNDLLSYLEY